MEAIFVWPNLLLQFMPDQLAVVQVLPAATGTCSLREVSYGVPDASARIARGAVRQRARATARARAGHPDPGAVQEGLASVRSDRAGLLATNETGLHWFVERLRAAGPRQVQQSPFDGVGCAIRRRCRHDGVRPVITQY